MTKNLISNGFVASHLADLLLSKGEEIYVYYRWTDDRSSFDHIKDKVNWCLMDLNDLSSCLKVIEEVKPDYVYHLGAQSSVPASFIYPEETLRTNILGTYNLLEAIRIIRDNIGRTRPADVDMGFKFNPIIIIVSSSEVYGNVSEENQPITENTPLNPNNPYAVGKIGEDMIGLVYWKNYGLKIIRTRFFTHTGPRRQMMSAECFYAKWIAETEKQILSQGFYTPEQEFICKVGNNKSIRRKVLRAR